MIQEIAAALAQSWRDFATAFILFVPRLVAATIIFAGRIPRGDRRQLGRATCCSGGCSSTEWLCAPAPARCCASRKCRAPSCSSPRLSSGSSGSGFIVSALDTLQFGPFQGLVQQFFRFVPRCAAGSAGAGARVFWWATFVWRATLLASVNAGLPAPACSAAHSGSS